MALKPKTISQITFGTAFITWLIYVFCDLTLLYSESKKLPAGIPIYLPGFVFLLYITSVYFHFRTRIEKNDTLSFTDLLWKVFAVGLVSSLVSLTLFLLLYRLQGTHLIQNFLFRDFILQVNIALLINLLFSGFFSWKRLIMYQKTKWLVRLWFSFELLLFGLLLLVCFNQDTLLQAYHLPLVIVCGVLIFLLSTNMRWVAYLNFKQKWTGLVLLLLTMLYLLFLGYQILSGNKLFLGVDQSVRILPANLFSILVFSFVITFSLIAFLVIFFNLPTSSVFEQKLEETMNFQRLSQSIQTEQSEESVYNILLESSISTVFADAGWLEINQKNGEAGFYTHRIKREEAERIREHIHAKEKNLSLDSHTDKSKNPSRYLKEIKGTRYRSIIQLPIYVKNERAGKLTLLKELPNGFNKEMTRIVTAFANQAGISIENFRLLEEAFQNERYKEELKIAKEVQKSLLPQKMEQDALFAIHTFSQAADEVGGDYYDSLRLSEHEIAWIIADVSGKGTTAAFHMSQLKGVFHSLAQLQFDPKEFMITANMALKSCLEKNSFISAAYFVLNTATRQIIYCRAGHCPILYHHHQTKETGYLSDKGTALGMIRNENYGKTLENYTINFAPNDVMVLYTDGITEAANGRGEEFGMERLSDALKQVLNRTPAEMEKYILDRLYEFTGSRHVNDDYTMMIIKFN